MNEHMAYDFFLGPSCRACCLEPTAVSPDRLLKDAIEDTSGVLEMRGRTCATRRVCKLYSAAEEKTTHRSGPIIETKNPKRHQLA